MRIETRHRIQMKFTAAQIRDYTGEFPGCARRSNSEIRRGFGVSKFFQAVVKQGGKAPVQGQIATVDLRKMLHDISQVLPLLTDQAREASDQHFVR
jgi:hypothetical protein